MPKSMAAGFGGMSSACSMTSPGKLRAVALREDGHVPFEVEIIPVDVWVVPFERN